MNGDEVYEFTDDDGNTHVEHVTPKPAEPGTALQRKKAAIVAQSEATAAAARANLVGGDG
jgi:hypothetical protein